MCVEKAVRIIQPVFRLILSRSDLTPGVITKFNLATFTEVTTLTLSSGLNKLYCAVIDSSLSAAYFG